MCFFNNFFINDYTEVLGSKSGPGLDHGQSNKYQNVARCFADAPEI